LRILRTDNSATRKGLIISALLGQSEFEQLHGCLEDLCLFSTKLFTDRATFVKTGARHSMVKYVLVPTAQRAKLKLSEHDFDNLTCASVTYRDSVFLIYKVPRILPAKQATKPSSGTIRP